MYWFSLYITRPEKFYDRDRFPFNIGSIVDRFTVLISICDDLESDLVIAVIGTYLLFTRWIGTWEQQESGRAFVFMETIRGHCFLYARWSL
jgi:hypothetical protein